MIKEKCAELSIFGMNRLSPARTGPMGTIGAYFTDAPVGPAWSGRAKPVHPKNGFEMDSSAHFSSTKILYADLNHFLCVPYAFK